MRGLDLASSGCSSMASFFEHGNEIPCPLKASKKLSLFHAV
jgi:hypothetical protein